MLALYRMWNLLTCTCICGFLNKLDNKLGISTWLTKILILKDMLEKLGIDLNKLPILDARQQLPYEAGHKLASL